MKLGCIQGLVIFMTALALTAEPSDALLGNLIQALIRDIRKNGFRSREECIGGFTRGGCPLGQYCRSGRCHSQRSETCFVDSNCFPGKCKRIFEYSGAGYCVSYYD